jgi:hypothetical protein
VTASSGLEGLRETRHGAILLFTYLLEDCALDENRCLDWVGGGEGVE